MFILSNFIRLEKADMDASGGSGWDQRQSKN